MLTITDIADEKLKDLIAKQDGDVSLRLAVVGGGCSGFEYDMGFDHPRDNDEVQETATGVRVIIDPLSYRYLDGITVDFVETLQGAGFTFDNPNATRTCGCGKSFQA